MFDFLIVGAGFAGSILAERLAREDGARVLLIDRRPHIAGNAFDDHDDAGILVHRYGPHIFHTNSPEVFAYLSRFTEWRPYQHRVLASVEGRLVPIPINLDTVNTLFGLNLTSDELAAWFERVAEPRERILTAEDAVVSKVGRQLYTTFFRGYTRKQWGLDPSELDKSVTARVPARTNTDDRYFTDSFQAMPRDGYTPMFEAMLEHPNIDIELGVDFEDVRRRVSYDKLVFTGPIDEFFGHRLGRLPYRSLRFQHETYDVEQVQPVATINFPQTEDYTRVTEYKHLTGQQHPKTSVTFEYPSATGDPYYPIPRPENQALYRLYRAEAQRLSDVWFVGRLGSYQYLNMDQVVAQALATFDRINATRAPTAFARAAE